MDRKSHVALALELLVLTIKFKAGAGIHNIQPEPNREYTSGYRYAICRGLRTGIHLEGFQFSFESELCNQLAKAPTLDVTIFSLVFSLVKHLRSWSVLVR